MGNNHSSDQVFTDKLKAIIYSNLGNENFGVNELVQQAGISHYSLSKKLHAITGKTITQFIRDTRLLKALEMLQTGDLTAAEVAYKTGFGSATYFNTCFTDFFGYPPGKVKRGEASISSGNTMVETSQYLKKRYSVKYAVLSLFGGIIILFGLFYLINYLIFKNNLISPVEDSVKTEKSIAVIPFRNLSDSAGNQYFADGITEDILTLFSKVPELRVVSRTSMEQFRESKTTPMEIAKKLKVNYLVEGSVQKSGNTFRIWIQLIDKKGNHLWAEIYDGKYSTDIFTFQSMVAKKVAVSLNAVITPQEEKRIDTWPTENMSAHDLLMKGKEMSDKFWSGGGEQYLKAALNLFDDALKIDPNYIQAMQDKAFVLLFSGNRDSAMVYYRKILAIDKENPNALHSIGTIYFYDRETDSALLYLQKAIDNSANDSTLIWKYMGVGQVLFMHKARIIEALPYYQKAYDLGGVAIGGIHYNIALLYSSIGDYTKAFKYMRNALSMSSTCLNVWRTFEIMLVQQQYDKALIFLDSIDRITPCEEDCNIMRFCLYTTQKEFAKADTFLNKALNSGYKPYWDDQLYLSYLYKETGRKSEANDILLNYIKELDTPIKNGKKLIKLAAAYAILGDNKKALYFLSELEQKIVVFETPVTLEIFPGFDNLRNNHEFEEIVRHLKEKRDSLRTQVRELELQGKITL
jgi:TolB-like protein/AraC-like DNA-binding protein